MKKMRRGLLLYCCLSIVGTLLLPISVCAKEVTVPLYHMHLGSPEAKGGCYTKGITSTETYTYEDTHGHVIDASGVCVCGNISTPGSLCQRIVTKTGTREVVTKYIAACGMSEDAQIGTLSLKTSQDIWSKQVEIVASCTASHESFTLAMKPYIWNGGSPTHENKYIVNENGTYSLELLNQENERYSRGAIIRIHNIDHQAPTMDNYKLFPDEWTNDAVRIEITGAMDRQEDGSSGSGLATEPFLWQGMSQWTAEGYTVEENGTVWVQIRDRLGNSREEKVTVRNIDKTAPVIKKVMLSDQTNAKSVNVCIVAEDLQPDTSQGCGLHEEAYSWDGGKTWQSSGYYEIVQNGSYTVQVRDALGNVQEESITVNNIDCTGPDVSYANLPTAWTNQDVTVEIAALDKNEYGTRGIGLHNTPVSWDEGETWGNDTSYVMQENGTKTVWVRDANQNITKQEVAVANIDKVAPTIELEAEQMQWLEGETEQIVLTVTAADTESGLAEKAYSWDNGEHWQSDTTFMAIEPGEYQVSVCDKAGNITSSSITIANVAKPTEPSEPEKPAEPSEPEEPAEPSEPEEPTDPSEPEEPSEPVEPSEPTEPEGPAEPSEPTEPEGPAEPTEPEEPAEPTEPEEPAEPTEPSEPEEPSESAGPSEPAEPTEPSEPAEPEKPEKPKESEKPSGGESGDDGPAGTEAGEDLPEEEHPLLSLIPIELPAMPSRIIGKTTESLLAKHHEGQESDVKEDSTASQTTIIKEAVSKKVNAIEEDVKQDVVGGEKTESSKRKVTGSKPQTVIAVCGSGIIFVGICAIIAILLLISVELRTLDIQGNEVILGRCFVYKRKEGWYVFISREMYEESETGEFKFIFRDSFVVREKGSPLFAICQKKRVKLVVRQGIQFHIAGI